MTELEQGALGEDRQITKEKTIAYKAWLLEHYETSSVNSMLVALNSFLSWAGDFQDRIRTVKVQQQMFSTAEKEMTPGFVSAS